MIPVARSDSAYHYSRALLATVIFEAALIGVVTFVRIDATSGAQGDRMVLFGWFSHSGSILGFWLFDKQYRDAVARKNYLGYGDLIRGRQVFPRQTDLRVLLI
jgi:hypothetical protein